MCGEMRSQNVLHEKKRKNKSINEGADRDISVSFISQDKKGNQEMTNM